MSQPKLVAVTAGLSKPSSTRLLGDRLTHAAADRLSSAGRPARTENIELRDLAVDIANHLVTGFPSARLRDALDAVSGADALIVVTPVFTGSYSGLFKSFFDLLDPGALTGTPVLLGATGGTPRHSLVIDHALRPLFAFLHALALPTAVFAATDDWGAGADPHTGDLPARIERAGHEFADLVVRLAGGPAAPTPAAPTPMPMPKPTRQDDEDEVVPFEQLLADLG